MTSRTALRWATFVGVAAFVAGTFIGCGGSSSATAPTAVAPLACDDSMKAAFKPDANTSVLTVKAEAQAVKATGGMPNSWPARIL